VNGRPRGTAACEAGAGLRYDENVRPRRIVLIFVDGLGLGADDPAVNPAARAAMPAVRRWTGGALALPVPRRTGGAVLLGLDACLGVAGLPQSATGQTALLTGRNAPALIGRHLTAYPTPRLAAVLASDGLMGALRTRGLSPALANAYTPAYFEAVAARRLRYGAITLHALQAGIPLRTVADLAAGRAVYHDLINARARERGADVPVITPEAAGRHLAGIAAGHAFTLFEMFETDLAGHGRVDGAVAILERLDRFLGAVLEQVDLATTLVLLTSDHGNVEDAQTRGHTANPVPALLAGAGREDAAAHLHAITDVAPVCLALLDGTAAPLEDPGAAAAPEQPAAPAIVP
jgi:2,3-bisphosphoglycerate-independent phosphoglycerate mutase